MITTLPLKVRYALAAGVCLADNPKRRRSAKEIAASTNIPPSFLAKVLHDLSNAGLVNGERGHGGGYRLAKPAESIMLGDVIDAMTLPSHREQACAMGNRKCNLNAPCQMHELWTIATAPMERLASTVSLARLAKIS